MTKFLWATPDAEQEQTVKITLEVSPRMVLALAAALSIADDEAMRDDGNSEEIIAAAGEAFDALDHIAALLFGENWPFAARAKTPAQRDLFAE